MKLVSLLKEGLSPIVFHYTNIDNLRNVLKENKFRLSIGFANPSDRQLSGHRLYFLSVSRIKFGGYARSEFYKTSPGAIVVLDGSKLNNNYKGISVDYWGEEWRTPALKMGDLERFLKNQENEERLISNMDEIPNAKKYIKEIHIYIPPDPTGRQTMTLKEISKSFQPIYYYRDENAFKLLNKNKAERSLTLPAKKPEKNTWKPMKFDLRYIPAITELAKSKDFTHLSQRAQTLKWELIRGPVSLDDVIQATASEVHNERKKNTFRNEIRELGKMMLKYKTDNLVKFITKIANRIAETVK